MNKTKTYNFGNKGQYKQDYNDEQIAQAKTIAKQIVNGQIPQPHMPVFSCRTGALQVAVWENEGTANDGQPTVYKSITFERRYKDHTGQWRSTNSLRTNDLPKAALLLNKAYEYCILGGESDE